MNPFIWLKWTLWRWGITFMYKLYLRLEPKDEGSYTDLFEDVYFEAAILKGTYD